MEANRELASILRVTASVFLAAVNLLRRLTPEAGVPVRLSVVPSDPPMCVKLEI